MQDATRQEKTRQDERQPYKPPRIIHEGDITTRAGSPTSDPLGIDPSELFDD